MPIDVSNLRAMIEGRVKNLERISFELPQYVDLIERAARGDAVDRDAVLHATGIILDNLYRGLLSPHVSVPKNFWLSPLGLSIARAHSHVIRAEEVMSQSEAAHVLGVSREYVSQLVESGKVATVVREAAAPRSRKQPREMLFRSSVAALRLLGSSRKNPREEVVIEGRP